MRVVGVLQGVAWAVLAALGVFLGYRVMRAQVAEGVYRERLATIAQDYESLRGRYNDAVTRTAVTELIVKDHVLSVRVRTAEGVIADIPTPFDPRGEVYVDYVLIDQRLWIRRVFDARTPPERGVLIDPRLADVNWGDAAVGHGKAVYRALGEGRWIIAVSGDGALTIARARDDRPSAPAFAPLVREHSALPEEARARVDRIGPGDVLDWLLGK